MDNLDFIGSYLADSISVKQALKDNSHVVGNIAELADRICAAYASGNKVLLAGNGGSAADCQHIAAEFVSRFLFDRPGLPSIALSTDTSMLTAIGNDYGFDKLFSRQLQAQSKPGDVFIGISTSGRSANIIKAVECAKDIGVYSAVFCGEAGELSELAHLAIQVPSKFTPYIQECHICIGHIICAIVEQHIFGKSSDV